MAEREEELKSHLMKMKEESEKAGLKLNIQKTEIMASSLITSWGSRWGNNGNSNRLSFLGLQSHCGCDCSHEIKGILMYYLVYLVY